MKRGLFLLLLLLTLWGPAPASSAERPMGLLLIPSIHLQNPQYLLYWSQMRYMHLYLFEHHQDML